MNQPCITVLRDIVYHDHANLSHGLHQSISKNRLDLYLPNPSVPQTGDTKNGGITQPRNGESPSSSPPVVVFVHGGGWRRGHKQQWQYFMSAYDTNPLAALVFRFANLYRNIGESFAKNGIACAVISYPLMTPSVSVTLVELVTSSLMSSLPITAFFALLMLSLWLFLHLLCLPFTTYPLANNLCKQIHMINRSRLTVILPSSILVTQLIIWVCICLNISHYKEKHRKFLTLGAPLALLGCMLYFCITPATDFASNLWTLSNVLTLVLQFSIGICQLLFTSHTSGQTKCRDQIEAVARSIQWLKTYGQGMAQPPYDPENIVLVGHSAGSHLINMLVLNSDSFLDEFHLRRKDFKGVISLSGIHNLSTLDFGATRYLYLSIFGFNSRKLSKLSPIKLVKEQTAPLPRFLIISADYDYDFLKKDATDYVGELTRYGYEVRYEIIPHTNHLTLPMRFGGSHDDGVLAQTCLQFVQS